MLQLHDITGESLWRVTMPGFLDIVVTLKGRIIHSASVLNRFINQPIGNLKGWVEANGGSVELLHQGWDD